MQCPALRFWDRKRHPVRFLPSPRPQLLAAVLPVRRGFLVSLLEAGLGDVEMESLRLEMLGEIAMDLGRCKMLVPVAMGKRREERGKYLVVLVRQPAGTWKILADCWSLDLTVSALPSETSARKGSEPSPQRKPR